MQEKYRTYLLNERRVKGSTVSCYMSDVDTLSRKMTEAGLDSFADFTERDFGLIIASLEHDGRSAASVQRFISSVKSFYSFLVYDGVCLKNPLLNYEPTLRRDDKHSVLLTELEVSRILSQPETETFKGIRDRAMLELSYASALRVTDMLNLNLADVNVFTGCVTCRQGKSVRYITLYPSAAAIMGEYITAYTRLHGMVPPNSPLFVNQQFKRLTRQGLWKIVKDYALCAGVSKEVTPLTLRQSFATHLCAKGVEAEQLKEIFDYRSIVSARVYAAK